MPVKRKVKGMKRSGNINLFNRPEIPNNGEMSTLFSMSFNQDGEEVLIPRAVNGQILSEEGAIQHYLDTGEMLGTFDSPESATAYSQQLSNDSRAGMFKNPVRVMGRGGDLDTVGIHELPLAIAQGFVPIGGERKKFKQPEMRQENLVDFMIRALLGR